MKIWIKYLIPKFGKQNNSVNKESKIEVIRIKAKYNEVEKRKIALSLSISGNKNKNKLSFLL